MVLNKQKGNMYGFVTHTWNAIKGKCIHNCAYCYMKKFKQKPVRLVESELKTDLGKGNYIFVGSGTDMFASNILIEWIRSVLFHCEIHPLNKYLFQTKNVCRFHAYLDFFPKNSVLCSTIETNRSGFNYDAPPVLARKKHLERITEFPKMVTIEPIMDFDLEIFVQWIKEINPKTVNIGADSKGHKLPEPSWDKVDALISELEKFTTVNKKKNLNRLKRK